MWKTNPIAPVLPGETHCNVSACSKTSTGRRILLTCQSAAENINLNAGLLRLFHHLTQRLPYKLRHYFARAQLNNDRSVSLLRTLGFCVLQWWCVLRNQIRGAYVARLHQCRSIWNGAQRGWLKFCLV